MRNIFKLVVDYICFQLISHCYRWIQVVLVTQRIQQQQLQQQLYSLYARSWIACPAK